MKNTLNPHFEKRQRNPTHTLSCRLVYVQDKSLSQPAGYFFPARGLYKSLQWFAEWGKIHLSASHFPLASHMTPGQVTKQVLKLWKWSTCQTSLASAAGLIAFKQVALLNCALWSVHLTWCILTALGRQKNAKGELLLQFCTFQHDTGCLNQYFYLPNKLKMPAK